MTGTRGYDIGQRLQRGSDSLAAAMHHEVD